ncbi:MAG: hypothetical protein K6A69_09200 [Lachnospiraceae bacterium]|nr:hypothetical protein [Lachnospiraceae bacterium]
MVNKRITALILAGLMAFSMISCGKKESSSDVPASAATETEENLNMANPWREVSSGEAFKLIANSFSAPADAKDVVWRVLDNVGDPSGFPSPLVELDFDLGLDHFDAREQMTDDKDADISGMYYEWDVVESATLANWAGGNQTATVSVYAGDEEQAQKIEWYDSETETLYCLSVTGKDLDGLDIQAVAESMYDSTRMIGGNAPEASEVHKPLDISGCNTFTDIVNMLSGGQGYANEQINGTDVFFVSSGTFDNMDGNQAAMDAELYVYDEDGAIRYIGYVECGGTAYPLTLKDGLLLVGGNHYMSTYTVIDNLLKVEDAEGVEYDSDGNGTYYYYTDILEGKDREPGEMKDDSIMTELYGLYDGGTVINFHPVE